MMETYFTKEEKTERRRFLRSQIDYYEQMAKVNSEQGNGEEWLFCIKEVPKLKHQLSKFQ